MSRARSKFSGPRKKERKAWNGYLAIFPLGVMRGFESLVITSRQWPLSPMKDVISVVILQIRHVRFLLLNEMNSLLGERLLQRIPLIRNLLSPLFFCIDILPTSKTHRGLNFKRSFLHCILYLQIAQSRNSSNHPL